MIVYLISNYQKYYLGMWLFSWLLLYPESERYIGQGLYSVLKLN